MVFHRNTPQQPQGGNMVYSSDGGTGVHVMGEQLREVDAPIEGLVGAARGLLNGTILGAVGSTAFTWKTLPERQAMSGKMVFNNMTSSHVGGVLGTMLAFSALSGFVRYSRAAKHNEWSQKHYHFLQSQPAIPQGENTCSFANKEDAKKLQPSGTERGV